LTSGVVTFNSPYGYVRARRRPAIGPSRCRLRTLNGGLSGLEYGAAASGAAGSMMGFGMGGGGRLVALAVGAIALGMSGCARDETTSVGGKWATAVAAPPVDARYGVTASPQIASASPSARAPRVRGTYKLGTPYRIAGRWYVPREEPGYDREGVASWYGPGFHGRKTANGEVFDQNAMTAAHPTLPMPSLVEVTNLANRRKVVVRVNDRGPYAHDRLIDLSKAVADRLGFVHLGTARVRVRFVGPASLDPGAPTGPTRQFTKEPAHSETFTRMSGRAPLAPMTR